MNRGQIADAVRQLLAAVFDGLPPGVQPDRDAILRDTPARVADALAEHLLSGYAEAPRGLVQPVALTDAARGPVVLRDVRFVSTCAHHLLPFQGVAHVGFVPDRSHAGLGAIARLVDVLSRRLQLQEVLTAALADEIDAALRPRSVVVVLEAEHSCLAARGARKEGHRLLTVERRGAPNADLDRLVGGPLLAG